VLIGIEPPLVIGESLRSVFVPPIFIEHSMDLFAILRLKIDTLPDGDYSPGLSAVLLHLETSFGHLRRGREDDENTAFTDVIYRTNQAFEGSVKEAYRVLAEKDPAKKTPAQIEEFIQRENIFRPKVMARFVDYRSEWRNKSTHDYKLDFDEGEALLAIVSVSAFAWMLIDQIAEKVAFRNSKIAAEGKKEELEKHIATEQAPLIYFIKDMLIEFAKQQGDASQIQTETQLLGSLAGFFASLAPSQGDCTVSHTPSRTFSR
jgi:hypothetical protein